MRRLHLNTYYLNGTVLMGTAVVLLAIALFTNRGDLLSAVLVIAGFASFLLGIFLLTYSGGEPIDPAFVSLLPVQDCINLCRIAGDLGISGAAFVIPRGDELRQFNPAGTFSMPPPGDDNSFHLTPPNGMCTIPSGLPLYHRLAEQHAWSRPSDPFQVARGIQEVAEEVYRLAVSAETVFEQDLFIVRLRDFRFIQACRMVQRDASPACCRMHPCPVCSLFMCMVASSLNLPCTIEEADVDPRGDDLTVAIRVLRGAPDSAIFQGTETAKTPGTFVPEP